MALRIIERDGARLVAEDAGEGSPVLLLHGLTATRRYVVMGSRALERGGHRVVLYDARGHGESSPAARPDAYGYEELAADALAVLDELGLERAVLAGASMGGHTALRVALAHPERVAGLVVVTPAYEPDAHASAQERFAYWDALADGLRDGGVDGFLAAYDLDSVPERWRDTLEKVVRQRLAEHDHPRAVADALRVVPRSRPFETLDDLAAIRCPTTIVASRDEADAAHPFAVGAAYAEAVEGARLVSEEEGESPIAWQGGRLSRIIAEVLGAAGPEGTS